MGDRLVNNREKLGIQDFGMTFQKRFEVPLRMHLRFDELGGDVGKTPHHVHITLAERGRGATAETAEGAVHVSIAEPDGNAEVRAHRKGRRDGQIARGGELTCIVNQLGKLAGHHTVTVGIFEWVGVADVQGNRVLQRIDIAKNASTILELRDERDFQAHDRAHGLQCIEHHVVSSTRLGAHATHFKEGTDPVRQTNWRLRR